MQVCAYWNLSFVISSLIDSRNKLGYTKVNASRMKGENRQMDDLEIDPFEHYIEVFKALSELTRLKIMWLLLSIDSKICVSEIIGVLGENQYNVSKHLKVLKKAGLVYEKKEGKWIFYHYRSSIGYFDDMIKKAVLTIPEDLLVDEVERCKKRLDMRVDEKCIVSSSTFKSKGNHV